MDPYIRAYEYEKNVNPPLESIPIITKNIHDCEYGITHIDLSATYRVEYASTSPNLLASFIKVQKGNIFTMDTSFMAASHFFYIMQGTSEIKIDETLLHVGEGDILISPFTSNSIYIKNNGSEDLLIYYINDSPLLQYLGSQPYKKTFKIAIYSKEFILQSLKDLANPNNNRKGILLSNQDTEMLGVNTITPVLWSLYNELPPKTNQRPHKHNSVALDLCITCEDPENIYSLIGEKIDEQGNIIDPIKVHWSKDGMFVTPPGLWHSHHNQGETYAYILPIQDAGLLLYQRILGIVLL